MLSIITPTLNAESYIESNILEIKKLNISYEHIIVDGGSHDDTLNIVSKYKDIIVIHQNDSGGMYSAIQQGIESSKGGFIAYINCDDLIIPNGFERLYSYIKKNRCDLAYSNSYLRNQKTKKLKKKYARIFGKLLLSKGFMPFTQPSCIFTRDIFNAVGGFDYKKYRLMGDRDFFQRVALYKNSSIRFFPIFSTIFLIREDSLGSTNIDQYLLEKKASIQTSIYPLFYLLFKIFGVASYVFCKVSEKTLNKVVNNK